MTDSQVSTVRMDAILRAVAMSTTRLLSGDRWDDRVDAVLGVLGAAAGVDRVYVFEVHREGGVLYASQRHEWVAHGVQRQMGNPELRGIPFEEAGFARWAELLSDGWCVSGDVTNFPDSERQLLQSQDVCSLVVVPIHVDGTWWGFMGFDATEPTHAWHQSEIEALQAAANCIGAAVSKERLVDELRASRSTYVDALRREREALRRLRELDGMKTTFIDAVSHELRTPLHNLVGMIATLREYADRLDPESYEDLMERLTRNGRRLERLVTDLLDLNRLHQRQVVLQVEDVELAPFLHEVVAAVEALQAVKVEVDVPQVRVRFDPTIARQVLEQLLENAVVHTGAQANVWVGAAEFDGGVRLVVEDDGPGVPAQHAETIFEPFEHGEVRTPHSPGTGIGLGLVARFASLHGGTARCVPRPTGGGVRFEVTLPSPVTADPRVAELGDRAVTAS